MATIAHVKGLPEVIANLKKEKVFIKSLVDRGLKTAALYVQGESQKRVPVDTGNLKASAFTRKDENRPLSYRIGYTANYAMFVHEAVGMKLKGMPRQPYYIDGTKVGGKGNYWDPQNRAGPKFLESVIREKRPEILNIVSTIAKGGFKNAH